MVTAALSPAVGSTSPLLWYSSRATGTVALVLLTGSVVLGLLTSARAGSERVPRFAVASVHRAVSLLSISFVALHVVTAAADTFVPVGWAAVVVPFVSGYSPAWVGVGAVAFDVMVAVTATSLLRHRMPARAWRAVHWLSYLCYPVALAHSIGVGTDLRFTWMDLLTAACLLAIVVSFGWRLWATPHRGGAATALPAGARGGGR